MIFVKRDLIGFSLVIVSMFFVKALKFYVNWEHLSSGFLVGLLMAFTKTKRWQVYLFVFLLVDTYFYCHTLISSNVQCHWCFRI